MWKKSLMKNVTNFFCSEAGYEQFKEIMECLMELSTNNDPKTYTYAKYLIEHILDFDFAFGLCLLRVILMNTSNLSSYDEASGSIFFT